MAVRKLICIRQAQNNFLTAKKPTTGSADICLIAGVSLDDVVDHFAGHKIGIEEGPVERTGATGLIRSVYVRDPDRNLLEISEYVETSGA